MRKKPVEIKDMFIDVGASSSDEAKEWGRFRYIPSKKAFAFLRHPNKGSSGAMKKQPQVNLATEKGFGKKNCYG